MGDADNVKYLKVVILSVWCSERRKCSDDEFQCEIIYQCIPKSKVKDNHEDCLDATDEGTVIHCYVS